VRSPLSDLKDSTTYPAFFMAPARGAQRGGGRIGEEKKCRAERPSPWIPENFSCIMQAEWQIRLLSGWYLVG
jgi:hypothetical protein